MYLKLFYSILHDEIDALFEGAILRVLEDTLFWDFSKLVSTTLLQHLQSNLSAYDLERAALLGELPTSFLDSVEWKGQFKGLGHTADGTDVGSDLATVITEWQKSHPKLLIPPPDPSTMEPRSILIPVDIPPMAVVHTADIRLQDDTSSFAGLAADVGATPQVCVNQLLPAVLQLKWTRSWDTGNPDSGSPGPGSDDLEFSFEVTAPTDTWLVAGRRKGHFVIPGPDGDAGDAGLTSAPDTEAEIPLLLVPLREGWLPYPSVDIREVKNGDGDGHGGGSAGAERFETDYRNLGETVRVIADHHRVTLSLDASGPGGGPLVLETESRGDGSRVVV